MLMKIENVFKNLSDQTIPKSQNKLQNASSADESSKVVGKRAWQTKSANKATQTEKQKLAIPKDFKPKVGLTAREQEFFENLFPRARKEIRAYVQQQQNVYHEKGKFVDLKG